MREPAVWIGFVLATAMAVIQSALFPQVVVLSYAPFLGLICVHVPFHQALWLAALSGCSSDLIAADPFGIQMMTSTIVVALLHSTCNRFSKEQPLQLCLFTALISAVMVPLYHAGLFLFDRRGPCSGKWAFIDFLTMPLVDAAYAFFWFVGPLLLWEWGSRQWKLWRLKRHGDA